MRFERVHFWHHNEGETPLWRHGRASLTLSEMGRHIPHSSRQQDLKFGAEWRLLVEKGETFGFGWQLKWGTNGSETTPDFSINLSRLGDFWFHAGGLIPYRWLERHTANGELEYETRVFGFTVGARGIRWECWARDCHWSCSDPWWMNPSWNWRPLFFGRVKTVEEVVASGTCLIPLPEANYPGIYETTRYEHQNTKLLGRCRDRLLGPRFHYRVNIEPGKSIPVPGKGENSWDCGDDGIYGMSVGGCDVEKAVAAIVESALQDRRRYGGMDMNIPQ